jgi:hypothetical protein
VALSRHLTASRAAERATYPRVYPQGAVTAAAERARDAATADGHSQGEDVMYAV